MPVLKTTPDKLPIRLGRPPLVDAIFEIRFQPTTEGVAQLLPGLFFARLGSEYRRSEAMPIASLPSEFRDANPSLRYQFHYRLSGDSAVITVGDRSAGVSALPPYQGWDVFRPRIESFLTVLADSNLVRKVERFSLKFVNVISVPDVPQLKLLNLKLALGGVELRDNGFQMRTELNSNDLVRIVDIQPNAIAKLPTGAVSGLLLSIDCIRPTPDADIKTLSVKAIEEVHLDVKQLFFALITPNTLSSLEPSY